MNIKHWLATTALTTVLALGPAAAQLAQARDQGLIVAQNSGRDDDSHRDRSRDNDHRDNDGDRHGDNRGDDRYQRSHSNDYGDDYGYRPAFRPDHRGHAPVFVPGRSRHYKNIVIVRPHGQWYRGYGHYRHDDDAFKWLAFTAITLVVLDVLNESQQRAHERAQISATTAPVGDAVRWHENGASGSVTTLRDGYASSGRYCREFQQSITVGGRSEDAYGTACQQREGSWQIIDTSS
jgi:17 kDa outer membrane surface antigen